MNRTGLPLQGGAAEGSALPRDQHGQPAAPVGVPERPALASNVQLVGEMPETGFKDRQWLIRRDGRFVQVSELLYRVAERANGERTLEEIAEGVTESTEWLVDAESIRYLIGAKLMPLGIVAAADGLVVSRSRAEDVGRTRSPLAIHLRMSALSPRLIDPITKVLQVLFFPPVLISLLIAAAAAHWWLYRVHGIADSIRDVLYTPGGLLLALVLILLGGIFHEFGHASALRYGGGRVGGMGAGLYFIWPVLYTDVTDSYRLGRWARVRTDLGGIYFHLIFTLGLIALSVLTGRELLLFAALLINLQVLGQFIPFGRFDGYWVLADLTGIPDFFSMMGPFVRSLGPARGPQGSRLPDLKPWVKGVFAAYILATIPLLSLLIVLMVKDLPRLLLKTWDALLIQARLFPVVLQEGSVLTMLLVGTQVLLLTLPVLGTLYVLGNMGRTPIRLAWNWSKPTPTRRALGALGAAAACGSLGLLWAPHFAGPDGGRDLLTRAIRTDPRLAAAREAIADVRVLQADLEGFLGRSHFTGTVVLQRPNRARIHFRGEDEDFGEFLVNSDGKDLFVYFPGDNQYARSRPGPQGLNIHTYVAKPIEGFFQPGAIGASPPGGRSSYVGRQAVDGVEYDVVEVVEPSPRTRTTRYFIAPGDRLIHRTEILTRRKDGATSTTWIHLKNIRTDGKVDESTFRWTPPESATPLQMPSGVALPLSDLKKQ